MLIFQLIALLGFLAGLYGLYLRYAETRRRPLPPDRSPLKGNPTHGIVYAFTAGMMPWAKESTRLHGIAYLRGIGFHLGIFAALGAFLLSPFWGALPALLSWTLSGVIALGAILGAAGGVLRLVEHNLRGLSLPDDHFAVWLVSAWLALSAIALHGPGWLPAYYLLSAVTLAYIPLGKIRHCLYFFFSRIFFGRFFGRRGVFPHPKTTQ